MSEDHGLDKKEFSSELWHACAGSLVRLPDTGTRVVYFPQGHREQVAALTNKDVEGETPNCPNLPPQLICQLHDVTMHADLETDQVYAHMTLQPLNLNLEQIGDSQSLPAETGIMSKPANYFWKTVVASDIKSFNVPRSDAERIFPALDSSQQGPAQELIVQDIHQVEWKFKHVLKGQHKRHFLTTGWGLFVTTKRLVAGDSLLFMWNEKNQIWVGIRRAIRRETVMHIDHMASAARAASTNSRFTIFYSPRACPSEFVIPLSKVRKAAFRTQISAGMRFRMLFETEGLVSAGEVVKPRLCSLSGEFFILFFISFMKCRYMGMITEVSDADPLRWANSRWRSVKVRWDESASGERPPRVSLWEIEPTITFTVYPSLFPLNDSNATQHQPQQLLQMHQASMSLTGVAGDGGQRLHPSLPSTGHDQYQAVVAAAAAASQSGGYMEHQFLNFQQPTESPQEHCSLMGSQSPSFGDLGLLNSRTSNDGSLESILGLYAQNQSHFCPQVDSSSLLYNMEPNMTSIVADNNMWMIPYGSTYLQSSMYDCLDGSSGILQSIGGNDPTHNKFVKVFMSESTVGRSLDITRFSNYAELREELCKLFGISGQWDGPDRSGWLLVFVDMDNELFLLGDESWESFLKTVQYIKILSPEDVYGTS